MPVSFSFSRPRGFSVLYLTDSKSIIINNRPVSAIPAALGNVDCFYSAQLVLHLIDTDEIDDEMGGRFVSRLLMNYILLMS